MLDKTFVFCYDGIGNITSVETYNYTAPDTIPTGSPTTKTFTYSADKLTAFGDKAITYHNGEMTSYDGWDYSWSKGKLSSIRKHITSNARAIGKPNLPSSQTYSFVYNAFGQRTGANYSYFVSPTSSTNVSLGETLSYAKKFYYDHAGRLMFETKSTNLQGAGEENYKIAYLYDESSMIGMEYTKNNQSTLYYFQRNLQGDVIGIYDTNGNLKVRYIYDAWGNCTIDNTQTTDQTLAKNNPIRYRGYYFDVDTGLYYLNARYYSPDLRRFISPDDTAYLDPETVDGLNLYAYCCNDPVNYADPSGNGPITAILIGLGIGLGLGLGYAAYTDYSDDTSINGSVGWQPYLGYSMMFGSLGMAAGYLWPLIAAFLGSSFTFTLPTLGMLGTEGILVADATVAAAILGETLILTGIIALMSKHRPGMSNKAPFSWTNQQEGIDAMKRFNGDANKAADDIMNRHFQNWKYGAGNDRNVIKKWLDRIIRKIYRG